MVFGWLKRIIRPPAKPDRAAEGVKTIITARKLAPYDEYYKALGYKTMVGMDSMGKEMLLVFERDTKLKDMTAFSKKLQEVV
jgi:hypothetical protein